MDKAEVMQVLRQVEWGGYVGDVDICPCCLEMKTEGHADDCKLAALLGEAEAQSPVDTVNESWQDRQKRKRRVVELACTGVERTQGQTGDGEPSE